MLLEVHEVWTDGGFDFALDIIGCGLDFAQGCGFYTKNGVFLGDLFHGMNQTGL